MAFRCSKTFDIKTKFIQKGKALPFVGLEPPTSRLLGERDNHYTTDTSHFMNAFHALYYSLLQFSYMIFSNFIGGKNLAGFSLFALFLKTE